MANFFKKAAKKVAKVAKKTTKAVYKPIKQLDITSSKTAIGSKIPSKVRKGIKKVGTYAVAPLVVPTAIAVKGATYLGSKTGAKPLKKLDKAVGKVYRASPMKSLRDNYAKQIATGAAVGGAIAGAQGMSGLADAAGMAGGLAGNLAAPELQVPEAVTVEPPEGTTAAPPAASGSGSIVAAAGAAAVGAMALGPLGIAAGVPVYLATRKK